MVNYMVQQNNIKEVWSGMEKIILEKLSKAIASINTEKTPQLGGLRSDI